MKSTDWDRVDQPQGDKSYASEPAWAAFVRAHGGEVIEDLLPAPSEENADFLFRDWRSIVELKILETDALEQSGKVEKIRDILRDHQGSAYELDKKIATLLYEPLLKIIKKANRQISGAKNQLQLNSDFFGMVSVINDGWFSLSPLAFVEAMDNIFKRNKGRLRHVHGVFLYYNFPLKRPEDRDVRNHYPTINWRRRPFSDEYDRFSEHIMQIWGEYLHGIAIEHGRTHWQVTKQPDDYSEVSQFFRP